MLFENLMVFQAQSVSQMQHVFFKIFMTNNLLTFYVDYNS